MQKLIFNLVFVILLSGIANAQLYQGPANGSVPNGVTVNTLTFLTDLSIGEPVSKYVRQTYNKEEFEVEPLPDYLNNIKSTGPAGSNIVLDKSISDNSGTDNQSLLIKTFEGARQTSSIPPDTYIAAGPTHLMGVCNSNFYIWDKNGNVVNLIASASWYSSALSGASPFDPKVSYDQIGKRWIMVWLHQDDASAQGYFLISVSDDSIPTGTWYNWAIKSSLNGSTEVGQWGDYQGVGFDNQAIYLTTNQFTFAGNFAYNKIRIIGKSQLYNNTAGSCAWTDIWDIRDPSNGTRIFGSRPTIVYGNTSEAYFIVTSPFVTGTYITLYKLSNPLSSPTMTGTNIPVVTYLNAPQASQLGGGTPLETGGSGFRFESIYRGGFLYAVHAVGSFGSYSSISYYKINPSNNAVIDDAAFGADGYWHFYPAMAVDKDNNIAMTYSRSSLSEYVGAYFNSRLNTDPPNTFNGSGVLKAGEGNYNVVGGGRNRWGDYMGMWLDPSDENNIWMHTEYAKAPSNTWANRVGLLRLSPYSSARVFTNPENLTYGNVEVGTLSDTQYVKLTNFGNTVLTITNLQISSQQYQLIGIPSLPVNINFNDSIIVKIRFNPFSQGIKNDSLIITSNDLVYPNKAVHLSGNGYVVAPASNNVIYGVTGSASNGILLTVNSATGAGTSVGASGFSQLSSISVRPSDNKIFSIITGSSSASLVRVNSAAGDAYFYSSIPYADLKSMAFDLNDDLYCASIGGKIYRYNTTTYDTLTIGNTGNSNLFAISINPLNGQLWGISAVGTVYKINKQTGTSQSIGSTGQSPNSGLAFNKFGKLYGVKGVGVATNNLISIDTATGSGTVIGPIGFNGINGIAISPDIVGIQSNSSIVPVRFELNQNYPNPFNPGTTISFSIPYSSIVKLNVYDITGREVKSLLNQNIQAGSYNYYFDGSNLASGVYYYKLDTEKNSEIKKMILLK